VLDLAAELVATPFDPLEPCGPSWWSPGWSGGRAALVQRMHHAITDGKGGIRISEQFVDVEPDAAGPTPDPFDGADRPPDPHPTWFERFVDTTVERARDSPRPPPVRCAGPPKGSAIRIASAPSAPTCSTPSGR
jgi:diacylglycerol O-acyltransferase / wax synthase